MSESDREAALEGSKKQEIKKVNDSDIMASGIERGKMIASVSQKILGTTLKKKIEEDGIEQAIKYCNLAAYPLVDSLSNEYSAVIKRVSMKLRNPQNKPDSIEQMLLDAYQYTIDQGEPVTDNIQEIHKEYLLYTKPILIGDPLCLQCHGKIGEELKPETNQLIKSLYPDDKATGYAITELRGMWSIRLEKKDIINSL